MRRSSSLDQLRCVDPPSLNTVDVAAFRGSGRVTQPRPSSVRHDIGVEAVTSFLTEAAAAREELSPTSRQHYCLCFTGR